MKEILTFRMSADIIFNRPITEKDYISPGGFEMIMNGRLVQFDFEEHEAWIDKDDPSLLHVNFKNPDYDAFEDLLTLTKNDLRNVTNIPEFFVFTGEPGESDLKPTAVKKIVFVLPYKNWMSIPVSKEVCNSSVVCCNF